MLNRQLQSVISARISEKKPLIQVVVGPRQIGKTTALKAALSSHNGLYFSADSPVPQDSQIIIKWWEEAQQTKEKILAIDEVQKITGWSEAIKFLWDKNPKEIKLILTGSSALNVEKGLTETLAGRFELIQAEHWNFSEAQHVFNTSLKDFITYGCYPGAQPFLQDGHIERWGNYVRDSIVEPAIGRDILQLHPIKDPALLRQVFGLAVSLPASIVSFQKLQGAIQEKGTIATLSHYLHLLSQAFLVSVVQKFSPAPIRTKKSIPKLIIHDNALLRAFERPIRADILPERFGRYFENAVGARLIEAGWEVFYWKERDYEVDFVAISRENEKLAIEVKSQNTTEKELHGLKRFCSLYKGFEPCLISYTSQTLPNVRTLKTEEIISLARTY